MIYLVYLLIVFLAFLLQTAGFYGNLLPVVLLAVLLTADKRVAAFSAFLAGALLDLYSPFPLGLTSFIFLLFLLCQTLLEKVLPVGWALKLGFAALALAAYRLFLAWPLAGIIKDFVLLLLFYPLLARLWNRLSAPRDLQLGLEV